MSPDISCFISRVQQSLPGRPNQGRPNQSRLGRIDGTVPLGNSTYEIIDCLPPIFIAARSDSANEELLTRRRARASVAIYDVVQLVLHPEPSVTRLRASKLRKRRVVRNRIVVSGSSLAALKASVMAAWVRAPSRAT
jgi:hypothetical protein